MRLTDRLRVEHKVFRELLDFMTIAAGLPRDQALAELSIALRVLLPAMRRHERMEEGWLLPAYRRQAEENRSAVAAMSDSHKEIWKTLNFLADAVRERSRPASVTKAAAERFAFIMREHMEEEEEALYPAVEKSLGERRLLELDLEAEAAIRAKPTVQAGAP